VFEERRKIMDKPISVENRKQDFLKAVFEFLLRPFGLKVEKKMPWEMEEGKWEHRYLHPEDGEFVGAHVSSFRYNHQDYKPDPRLKFTHDLHSQKISESKYLGLFKVA